MYVTMFTLVLSFIPAFIPAEITIENSTSSFVVDEKQVKPDPNIFNDPTRRILSEHSLARAPVVPFLSSDRPYSGCPYVPELQRFLNLVHYQCGYLFPSAQCRQSSCEYLVLSELPDYYEGLYIDYGETTRTYSRQRNNRCSWPMPKPHALTVHMFSNSSALTQHFASPEAPPCFLLDFYSSTCPFSANIAPYVNALPPVFPKLYIAAMDAIKYRKLNTVYGVVGTPTILLFRRGKPIARYNLSDISLHGLINFVESNTDLNAVRYAAKSSVTPTYAAGPVPTSPEESTDYFFRVSWAWLFLVALYYARHRIRPYVEEASSKLRQYIPLIIPTRLYALVCGDKKKAAEQQREEG